jgi:hypothetical protein
VPSPRVGPADEAARRTTCARLKTRPRRAELAIPADSLARAVVFAMSQPPELDINEILYRPALQEYRGDMHMPLGLLSGRVGWGDLGRVWAVSRPVAAKLVLVHSRDAAAGD